MKAKLWLLAALLLFIACGKDSEEKGKQPKDLARPPTAATITEADLPYTFSEGALRITIAGIVPMKKGHGIIYDKAYSQWSISFQYENTLPQDWEAPDKGWPMGRCAGISSFKVVTDAGNTYKPRFVGGSPLCGSLKPQQKLNLEERYIFEIKKTEKPVEILAFDQNETETLILRVRR
ncbi:MAG: hypothetical protein JNM27_18415 [Leptospirales bacterium]|nr:hypothetical protein [Leptospirales bacterium]